MAEIFGVRHRVEDTGQTLASISQVAEKNGIEIQVFDATKIIGMEHLEVATEKAQRAFSEDRNLSNTLATEILLYASAERQISEAIRKLGIKDGAEELAVVILGDIDPGQIMSELGWTRDDSVLKPASETEIDQILEKMAMSELER